MTATKMFEELSPEQREKFLKKDDRLVVIGDGLKSPYFDIRPGIILNNAGVPLYDRPIVREAPSVVAVVWGLDRQGGMRVGIIRQKRPPADDPRQPGDGHEPVTFAQVVMGYLDGDLIEQGALREKAEELGKGKVLNVEILPFPLMNLEPNMLATWHRLAFVEHDLSTVDEGHTAPAEFITSVVYMSIRDLLRYTSEGWDETGACYREGHTLMALMIFFAVHPEFFPR